MDKKHQRLGMNASTAAHRLRMDILFKFVVMSGHVCHRCGGALSRDTFSIDHKTDWLDSANPVQNFFDLDNIAFSHNACNSRAGAIGVRVPHGKSAYDNGCRCEDCRRSKSECRAPYDANKRRLRYDRYGT